MNLYLVLNFPNQKTFIDIRSPILSKKNSIWFHQILHFLINSILDPIHFFIYRDDFFPHPQPFFLTAVGFLLPLFTLAGDTVFCHD